MVQFQYAFMAVLVGVLLAAVVSFVALGLSKVRRTARLSRAAHQGGMRFFPDDTAQLVGRYADFAVIGSGHSPCANNITDGRMRGRAFRAFDFRCEIGHGTRRMTRHYSVVVADAQCPPERLLMWNDSDKELAPLAARETDGRLAPWSYRGSARLAARIAAACPALAEGTSSIELRGSTLMVFAVPVRRARAGYAVDLAHVEALLQAVESAEPATTPTPAGES